MGVLAGVFQCSTGHAHRLRGYADAAAFQVAQGDAVSLALLAQAATGRQAQVVELDLAGVRGVLAELVLDAHDAVAGGVGGYDEGADALLARRRVGHGEDDHHAGMAAGSDELLAAVQYVMIAVATRLGAQVAGV
ncbi:hypothetical protein D3C78_754910 [compost metagenome]